MNCFVISMEKESFTARLFRQEARRINYCCIGYCDLSLSIVLFSEPTELIP